MGIADIRACRNVLGVAARGHVVRHDRALRPGGTLGNDNKHMRVVGRQLEVSGRLALLQFERRQLVLLRLLLPLLAVLVLLADVFDQLLFLVADEALAVGRPRLGPAGRCLHQLVITGGAITA